ncbi:hypothetical protein [Acetivibrio straminisolvens]|uniref:Uncharacterized protein n=1 Tax=Acetivibrio straminisolvens JCM 21531 TaxID=1294263 RepID=W4V457_9FIRM|nr:hypothetical protein [Acetivibrio straminisolvens]GAE87524.1 hypothetical protein JCM21531_896 [Acetivibrio straminisolvens JCM 21531]
MNQVRYYRKYPRTHSKQNENNEHNEARTIDLTIAQAAGILVLTFATGILSGCLLKNTDKKGGISTSL